MYTLQLGKKSIFVFCFLFLLNGLIGVAVLAQANQQRGDFK